MPGQWWVADPPCRGIGPEGCDVVELVPGDVTLVGLDEVVDVEVAALAIAAPPPIRAPVTARVVTSGLIRRMFTSFLDHHPRWPYRVSTA
jgi:hypothetical protein